VARDFTYYDGAGSGSWIEADSCPLCAWETAISLWVYPYTGGIDGRLFSIGQDISGYDVFTLVRADWGSYNAGASTQTAASPYNSVAYSASGTPYGQWSHILGLWVSATDKRCYANGGSAGTDTTEHDASPSNFCYTCVSGQLRADGFYFATDHAIAEVGIWDMSVWPGATASDRAANFAAVANLLLSQGVCPLSIPLGLKFYLPLINNEDRDLVAGLEFTEHYVDVSAPTVVAHPRVLYPQRKITSVSRAIIPSLSAEQVSQIIRLSWSAA